MTAGNAARVGDTQIRTTTLQPPSSSPKPPKRRRTDHAPALVRRPHTRNMTRTNASPSGSSGRKFFNNEMFDTPKEASALPPPTPLPPNVNAPEMQNHQPDIPLPYSVQMVPANSIGKEQRAIPQSSQDLVPVVGTTSPRRGSISSAGAAQETIVINDDSDRHEAPFTSVNTSVNNRINSNAQDPILISDDEEMNTASLAAVTAPVDINPARKDLASPIAPPPSPLTTPLDRSQSAALPPPRPKHNATIPVPSDDDDVQEVHNPDVLPFIAREKKYISATSSSSPFRKDGASTSSPSRARRKSVFVVSDGMLGLSEAREEPENTKAENYPQSPQRRSHETGSRRSSQSPSALDDSAVVAAPHVVDVDMDPVENSANPLIEEDKGAPKDSQNKERKQGDAHMSNGWSSMDEDDEDKLADDKGEKKSNCAEDLLKKRDEDDAKVDDEKKADLAKDEIKKVDSGVEEEYVLAPENRTLFSFPPTGRGKIRITYEDYLRVLNHEYLNDSILDFFIKMTEAQLSLRHPKRRPGKLFHFFSTFFFGRLRPNPQLRASEIDYEGVSRWTAAVDLFEKQYVFVPICESAHWSLLIMANLSKVEACIAEKNYKDNLNENEKPRMIYLDSLEPKRGKGFGNTMLSYVAHEYARRKHTRSDTPEGINELREELRAIFSCTRPYIPQQVNEVDCGLYVMHNMQCFIDNISGFRDECLKDALVDPNGKKRQVICRDIYSHSAIHGLREFILSRIRCIERFNATDRGKVPDTGADLLCDQFPEKTPPSEKPSSQNETMNNLYTTNDAVESDKHYACLAAAADAGALDASRVPHAEQNEVLVVGENMNSEAPPLQRTRKSRRLQESSKRNRARLERYEFSRDKKPTEITTTQMYGSSKETRELGGAVREVGGKFRGGARRLGSIFDEVVELDDDSSSARNPEGEGRNNRAAPGRRFTPMPNTESNNESSKLMELDTRIANGEENSQDNDVTMTDASPSKQAVEEAIDVDA